MLDQKITILIYNEVIIIIHFNLFLIFNKEISFINTKLHEAKVMNFSLAYGKTVYGFM